MSNSIKILVIGPSQSGKTSIANYLSERSNDLSKNYRPTSGVRILEFEKEIPTYIKKTGIDKAFIELWDGKRSSLNIIISFRQYEVFKILFVIPILQQPRKMLASNYQGNSRSYYCF